MLACACYFAAAEQSQTEVHHFLLGRSAYARLIYNLDPFCVLDNLYSVALDASIPLLFSHRVYRGSLSLVSSDTNERVCGIQHLTFSVISMSVAPTP